LPDSISLYTLEVSEKMKNYDFYWNDDQIFDEFQILKKIILDSNYARYEISNFTKQWKGSVQNQVYRNMENYIWFGVSASSFINKTLISDFQKIKEFNQFITKKHKWLRRTNTPDINKYIKWNYLDSSQINFLSKEDLLIEEFFLKLRTAKWIQNIDKFKSILVKNYQSLITNYKKSWLVNYNKKILILTDKWMNISNSIITDMLNTI
jgi:oxygen-independent coproporphyrinogen-3 oxidase